MLRSGLILAGVKQKQSGAGEDGVLTAQEGCGLEPVRHEVSCTVGVRVGIGRRTERRWRLRLETRIGAGRQ